METRRKIQTRNKENLGMSLKMSNICRGCMAIGRKMDNATFLNNVFYDLTGIPISLSDGLPQGLCYYCSALLQKYIKFKNKITKSHETLKQYVQDGTPFIHDDEMSPHLICTDVLCYEISGSDCKQLEEQVNDTVISDNKKSNLVKTENVEIEIESMLCDSGDNFMEEDWCQEDPVDKLSSESAINPLKDENQSEWAEASDQECPELEVKIEVVHESLREEEHLEENTRVRGRRKPELSTQRKVRTSRKKKGTEASCEEIRRNPDKSTDTDNKKIKKELSNCNKVDCKDNIIDSHYFNNTEKDESDTSEDCKDDQNLSKKRNRYSCDTCNTVFCQLGVLVSHMRKNHPDKQLYPCDMCDLRFYSKYSLYNHRNRLHIKKCRICSRQPNKRRIVGHICNHGTTTTSYNGYICHICGKMYKHKSPLEEHLRRHTVENKFKCDICAKTFMYKNDLNIHHVDLHFGIAPSSRRRFICDLCGACFARKQYITKHLRQHDVTKMHQCDICTRQYFKKSNLDKHMAEHLDILKCEMCDTFFKNDVLFYKHLQSHPGYKPFKCPHCPASFTRRGPLDAHVSTHTNYKPFQCDVCQKGFKTKSLLIRHNVVHSGVKPYKCEVCNASYANAHTLKIHMRKHTGEKPYGCDVCAKRFTDKCYLIQHIRKHTGEKPYQCDICMKRFSQLNSRNTHYRTHKRDETPKRGKRSKD